MTGLRLALRVAVRVLSPSTFTSPPWGRHRHQERSLGCKTDMRKALQVRPALHCTTKPGITCPPAPAQCSSARFWSYNEETRMHVHREPHA